MAIEVKATDERTYEVTVRSGSTTTHTVTVDPAYAERVGGAGVDVAALVERSFEFLLEREPNTSILRRFELPVIARYFPEYESEIGGRLA